MLLNDLPARLGNIALVQGSCLGSIALIQGQSSFFLLDRKAFLSWSPVAMDLRIMLAHTSTL